jgi:tRNA (Thr-GGU) A37 N-methylase
MTGTPDIRLTPIGFVHSSRRDLKDDDWDSVKSRIELTDAFGPEAFDGIEEFSHAEIVFVFDRAREREISRGARHPRGNPAWPAPSGHLRPARQPQAEPPRRDNRPHHRP